MSPASLHFLQIILENTPSADRDDCCFLKTSQCENKHETVLTCCGQYKPNQVSYTVGMDNKPDINSNKTRKLKKVSTSHRGSVAEMDIKTAIEQKKKKIISR